MVTLDFLARGGDSYPFPTGPAANIVNLIPAEDAPRTGQATFAADGSEQDALAEYLAANFSTTPCAVATDDEKGTIDGQAPGSAGYQSVALARATVLLSTLSANEFESLDPMRTIDVTGGKFLQFATIIGGTLGDVINGRGGEIIFATPGANGNGQSAIATLNALGRWVAS